MQGHGLGMPLSRNRVLYIIYYSWQTQSDVKEKIKSKVVLTSMAQWHSAAKLIKVRPGIAQIERFGHLDSKHVAKPNVTRLLLPQLLESVYKHYLQWHNSNLNVAKPHDAAAAASAAQAAQAGGR